MSAHVNSKRSLLKILEQQAWGLRPTLTVEFEVVWSIGQGAVSIQYSFIWLSLINQILCIPLARAVHFKLGAFPPENTCYTSRCRPLNIRKEGTTTTLGLLSAMTQQSSKLDWRNKSKG